MLMPRALDPIEAGKAMPLPEPRPASRRRRASRRRKPRSRKRRRSRSPSRHPAAASAAEIMTRKRASLSDDERALWETVTRAVAPLRRRKAKIRKAGGAEAAAPAAARSRRAMP